MKQAKEDIPYLSILVKGRLMNFDTPKVAAIINVTPDSFSSTCQSITVAQALSTAAQALNEGADILDIGACSTRPGITPIDEETEWQRLEPALRAIREAFPKAVISIDTFRSKIARKAVEHYGADIINDVSGGQGDKNMYETIANLHVPYILTHSVWDNGNTGHIPSYKEHLLAEVTDWLVRRLDILHRAGVSDVIIDPGFGFGKDIRQNYYLLNHLDYLQVLECPIMAALSRKRMIYEPLGIEPTTALNGTTAAHTIALMRGADILRVHDVKAAKEAITIYKETCSDFI